MCFFYKLTALSLFVPYIGYYILVSFFQVSQPNGPYLSKTKKKKQTGPGWFVSYRHKLQTRSLVRPEEYMD